MPSAVPKLNLEPALGVAADQPGNQAKPSLDQVNAAGLDLLRPAVGGFDNTLRSAGDVDESHRVSFDLAV